MITYKPKLMLFSHVSNTGSITGAEKLLLLFCLQLSPYFDCILTAPQEGKLTDYARKQGIQVRIQTYPLLFSMYHPGERLEQEAEELRNHPDFASVVRCITETAPDIVLASTIVNVLPAIAAKTLGIPVLWKITEIMQTTEFTAAAISVVEKYSDCLIAISEASARVFRGNVSRPITLLPPSSDNELLHPSQKLIRTGYRKVLRLKDSQFCIGYISSFIHPEKGLHEFIRMALILAESYPNCRFVMIGKPADHKYFDRCVAEVNASDYRTRFRFIPFVESVHSAYSAMDILAVPSMVKEGFGMTALEGMLCGKPVISFDSGGLGELMENTGNAHFTVPTGDYAALAVKAAELLGNPELMRITGSKNADAARTRYGMETYRQRVQTFVYELRIGCPDWMSGGISRSVSAYREPQPLPLPPIRQTAEVVRRKARKKKIAQVRKIRSKAPASRRYHTKRKRGAGKRSKRRSKSIKRR
ncbi:glycosyl transferase [Paenibacillus sp. J23TS9]|uniref:glycosyltransferase family 4 protein n=1 Tax=Paenibacillus sp. J23TS9 TaxID=2807193 RepID=UPI001B022237|nr:glycosyltransferase family 4 protein [Paenibacillus sp. J23TS9]GIP29947.1 glycosyl transferase [Paenibacillus sp. J23TS9]